MKNLKFKRTMAVLMSAAVFATMVAGCDEACYQVEIEKVVSDVGDEIQTIITDPAIEELTDPTDPTEAPIEEETVTSINLSETSGEVSINKAGSYVVSGKTDSGVLVIEATKEDVVNITLDNANITNSDSAAILVKKAKAVNITLVGKNTLTTSGEFATSEDNKVNAVIYSKADLTIGGEGGIIVNAPQGKGIKSKDNIVITGGTYVINALSDGINAGDLINITGGNLNIRTDDDGIHADGKLQIDGGVFEIDSAEGLEATYVVINDGEIKIDAYDDGISAALKDESYEKPVVEINGGKLTIVMAAGDTDGIDSNGDIIINGGYIDITGQSTCDHDGDAIFNGGTLILNGEQATEIPNQFFGPPPVDENGNPLPPPNWDPANGEMPPPPPMQFDENGNPLPPPNWDPANGEMPPPPPMGGKDKKVRPTPSPVPTPEVAAEEVVEETTEAATATEETTEAVAEASAEVTAEVTPAAEETTEAAENN